MNKEIIPIFFAIDDEYSKYLSVAISSLIKNASPNYFYKIHVIHEGVSLENQRKLKKLETAYSEIIFSEMDKNLEIIEDKAGTRLKCEKFTLTIFFRLFIPAMFPEYDKAIYMDSDIVVPGDISKLYNIDLGNNLIGGVVDKSVWNLKEITNYYINASGIDYHEYINSGVLLMNLKALRAKELDEKFLYLHAKYGFDSCCPDQDYLNVLCKGSIMFIDDSWNTMPAKGQTEGDKPNLIHYNLYEKPWHYKDVNYGTYFWDYAKDSEYYTEIKAVLDSFTEKDKQNDAKSLAALLELANEISASSGTFNEIFGTGKEERL